MNKYRITVSIELANGSHGKKIYVIKAVSKDFAEACAETFVMLEFYKIPYKSISIESCEILEHSENA